MPGTPAAAPLVGSEWRLEDLGGTGVLDRVEATLAFPEAGRVAGIFSERDYARKVVLQGKDSATTPVRDIMTSKLIHVTPEMTVDQAMQLMSDKRIRHLPVLDTAGSLVGVISIGDMVKETIEYQQFLIKQLESYIAS